jgi:EF-P beta-lysylation protein EpmB
MDPMEAWKETLKNSFTSLDKLSTFLNLSEEVKSQLIQKPKFPLLVPHRLAEKMEKGNIFDPIFRQFVPHNDELKVSENFLCDPVEDKNFRKASKLLSKYEGRVLLLVTSACAMHCRFCFRQNFNYAPFKEPLDHEFKLIEEDTSIQEVILSGGDPLSLSDAELEKIIVRLDGISHIKIVRFHTRFPIGIPERITDHLLSILKNTRLQVVFIIHANHEKELDETVLESLKRIQQLGIPVLCQTVLLQHINDSVNALKALCWKLISNGIIPYYLHQLDQVQGAMHMEVKKEKGLELIQQLKSCLPGYAVYRYVKEIPKASSKTELAYGLIE